VPVNFSLISVKDRDLTPVFPGETLQKVYIQKQLRLKPEERIGVLELIREKASIVTKDRYKTDRIVEDPDDNKFLSCALEAKANYVVSGDSHLLSLKHFHTIQIVDAATFIRAMERTTVR
jgi:putative PIN family toxin of toxin-antitoxin system